MQHFLFDGRGKNSVSVTKHLKRLISERFQVSEIPDAFLFMPEELGGLGLRNPFISLFLIRDQLYENPEWHLQHFLEQEKDTYEEAKEFFDGLDEQAKRRRLKKVHDNDPNASTIWPDADRFMSMEEHTRCRECTNAQLYSTFKGLIRVPEAEEVSLTDDVKSTLKEVLKTRPELASEELGSEKQWLVQFYSKELFDYCGGLNLVDKSLLPLGILTMLKSKKLLGRWFCKIPRIDIEVSCSSTES